MSIMTMSTIRMLCARSGVIRQETLEEAQRLLELSKDPSIAPEQKLVAKGELDRLIKEIEERVTTRRLKEVKQ